MSIEALELALSTPPQIRAVVVVPNFQNPLGCVMPDEERRASWPCATRRRWR
jgi:DNA-binding transcriptional MocR family regulator